MSCDCHMSVISVLCVGLVLGIKLFIIDNVYRKYPKVKEKYDGVAKLWRSLPTNAELSQRQSLTEEQIHVCLLVLCYHISLSSLSPLLLSPPPLSLSPSPSPSLQLLGDQDNTQSITTLRFSDRTFCERFQLSTDEFPLERMYT